MKTRIEYLDEDKLKIPFSTFVFNVSSINKKYGSLTAFVREYDLWGVTNGKLFYLAGSPVPTPLLYEKFQITFLPIGLKKGEDYIFIFEHPVSDVRLPHPSCVNIGWLGNEINRAGNFLWYRDSVRDPDAVLSFPIKTYILPPEKRITYKVLDIMDPDPELPPELFKKVAYNEFITRQDNCFPLFIGTHIGTFPEEVIPESLEGQIIALMLGTLVNGSISFVQIINGKRKELKRDSPVVKQ